MIRLPVCMYIIKKPLSDIYIEIIKRQQLSSVLGLRDSIIS